MTQQQLTLDFFTSTAATLNSDRIITLNCGLGRDSMTLVCLLAEGRLVATIDGQRQTVRAADVDAVVFSDTGAEWDHTYSLIPTLQAMCDQMGVPFVILRKGDDDVATMNPATSWTEITERAAAGAYHYRPAIMDDFASRSTVASLGKGDCTSNNKIGPIRRFVADLSAVRFGLNNREWSHRVVKGLRPAHVTLIGIAADETSRLIHNGKAPKYITEAYPLVDMGIAKADETPILERHGLGHVRKSGCYMCPYQPLSWYWALSETDPATFAAVVAYETKSLANNPNMSINGTRAKGTKVNGVKVKGRVLTISEQVTRWRAINPSATVDAVLAKEYAHCPKAARLQRKADKAALAA